MLINPRWQDTRIHLTGPRDRVAGYVQQNIVMLYCNTSKLSRMGFADMCQTVFLEAHVMHILTPNQ